MYTVLNKKKPQPKHIINGNKIFSTAIKSVSSNMRGSSKNHLSKRATNYSNNKMFGEMRYTRDRSEESDNERECRSKWVTAYQNVCKQSKDKDFDLISGSSDIREKRADNLSKGSKIFAPVYLLESDEDKLNKQALKTNNSHEQHVKYEVFERESCKSAKNIDNASIRAINGLDDDIVSEEMSKPSVLKRASVKSTTRNDGVQHVDLSLSDSEVQEVKLTKREAVDPANSNRPEKVAVYNKELYPKRCKPGMSHYRIKKIDINEIEATIRKAELSEENNISAIENKLLSKESSDQYAEINDDQYVAIPTSKFHKQISIAEKTKGLDIDKKLQVDNHETVSDSKEKKMRNRYKIIEALELVFAKGKAYIEGLLETYNDDLEKVKAHLIRSKIDLMLNHNR